VVALPAVSAWAAVWALPADPACAAEGTSPRVDSLILAPSTVSAFSRFPAIVCFLIDLPLILVAA
jgi:hypothetical protein